MSFLVVKKEEEDQESDEESAVKYEPKPVPSSDLSTPKKKRGKEVECSGPFPGLVHPLPHACHEARDGLALLHSYDSVAGASNTGLEKAEQDASANHSQQSILDSLVRTMLSQNTTDKTSLRAFKSLKAKFPSWEEVLEAPSAAIEDAIREGGLAEIKTARIKTILTTVRDEAPPGQRLSLEHLHLLSTEEVKATLSQFKGVGPKTVSCVLMFTMKRPEFPVDTHVWRISKRLGWVPPSASREKTYEHLNRRIPDAIKYDLHVLLVDHGKRCPTCLGKNGRLSKEQHGPCPLQSVSLSSSSTSRLLSVNKEAAIEGGGKCSATGGVKLEVCVKSEAASIATAEKGSPPKKRAAVGGAKGPKTNSRRQKA